MTSTCTPQRVARGLDEVRAVGRDPQPGGAHRRDRRDPSAEQPRRPSPRPRRPSARIGSGSSVPVCSQPVAEPSDLGAVDDRPPATVGAPLADVELHRVGADVDDRVPLARRTGPATSARARSSRSVATPARARAPPRSRAPGPPTRSRSSASIAVAVRTSVSSAMQPPIVYRCRRLCTSTASRSGCGPTTSSRSSLERVRLRARRVARPRRRARARCRRRPPTAGTVPSAPASTARARRRSRAGDA